MLKKFKGWIFPRFSPYYYHTHGNSYSALIGPLKGLRQITHVVTHPTQSLKKYQERIVYVGCVHGGNDNIYNNLRTLAKFSPDYLIFTGDLVGTSEIEKLKKQFYAPGLNSFFGDWVSTLPKEKRLRLLADLPANAKKLVKLIKQILNQGTKVYLLEGNWDNPLTSGINSIAGSDIKNVFDTQKFFHDNGLHFINTVKILHTKTTLHILLPYLTLLNFHLFSKRKIKDIQLAINQARYQQKTIIIVGHAEVNWRIHHLWLNNPQVKSQRALVIKNFGKAISHFKPDEVIYPHEHSLIKDEQKRVLGRDVKYLLKITNRGVELVENPQFPIKENHIIITYIPYGYFAERI